MSSVSDSAICVSGTTSMQAISDIAARVKPAIGQAGM